LRSAGLFSCRITCPSEASSGGGRRANPAGARAHCLFARRENEILIKPRRKSKQAPALSLSLCLIILAKIRAPAGSAADVLSRKLFQFGAHQAVVPAHAQPHCSALFREESTLFNNARCSIQSSLMTKIRRDH
jgi:hypothetical protein